MKRPITAWLLSLVAVYLTSLVWPILSGALQYYLTSSGTLSYTDESWAFYLALAFTFVEGFIGGTISRYMLGRLSATYIAVFAISCWVIIWGQSLMWMLTEGGFYLLYPALLTFGVFLASRLATSTPTSPLFSNENARNNQAPINTLHGGIPMTPDRSETTRHLAASAVLAGSRFRQKVIAFFENPFTAYCEEAGYDVRLILRLCEEQENREMFIRFAFGVVLVVLLTQVNALADLFSDSNYSYDPYYGDYESNSPSPLILLLALFAAWGLTMYQSIRDQLFVRSAFTKGAYQPDKVSREISVTLSPHLNDSIASDDCNVVIYNRFDPFVGAGTSIGGWSFVVNTSKPSVQPGRSTSVDDFTDEELHATIRTALTSLDIAGMKIRDSLFASGNDLSSHTTILPTKLARPTRNLSQEEFHRFRHSALPDVRYYQWIQVFDWGNEMVVSYFLRCHKTASRLFVEVSASLLTPLAEQYRRCDNIAPVTFAGIMNTAARSILLAPVNVLAGPVALLLRLGKAFSDVIYEALHGGNSRFAKQIIENPAYNYGATSSLREEFASGQYGHYFQLLDKQMYTKLIEQCILDSIVEFLDDHNVDTSDIKERQTTIINSGVIVQGGDFTAGVAAVGDRAQASSQTGAAQKLNKAFRKGKEALR